MRRNPLAARRYAQAFFELTDKHKEAIVELKLFLSVLENDRMIEKFFTSPIISNGEKILILADLRSKLPTSILFLEALIEANRMSSLLGIVEEFSRMCDHESGELSVDIESATALSDSALDEIRVLLNEKWKKKLRFQTKTNPELIGGFVARAPGKLLDASVASQLESLQEQVFA